MTPKQTRLRVMTWNLWWRFGPWEKRLPAIANVPTANESGFRGYEVSTWYGVLAPAGTPLARLAAVAAEDAKIGMPEVSAASYPALAGPTTQLRILRKHASWMILTGRAIDGRTAARRLHPVQQPLQAGVDAVPGLVGSVVRVVPEK